MAVNCAPIRTIPFTSFGGQFEEAKSSRLCHLKPRRHQTLQVLRTVGMIRGEGERRDSVWGKERLLELQSTDDTSCQ